MQDSLSIPVVIIELLPVGIRAGNPYTWQAHVVSNTEVCAVGKTKEEALEKLKHNLFSKLPAYLKSTEFTSIDLNEFLIKEVHES